MSLFDLWTRRSPPPPPLPPPPTAVAASAAGGIRQMTVQELQKLLADDNAAEGVQFVDVREQAEHNTAKLPRFELYPLSAAAK
jgi:hypothetical protein